MKCQECGVEFPAQPEDEICDSCDFGHVCAFDWQSFARGKAEYDGGQYDVLSTFDEDEEAEHQRIADAREEEDYNEMRDERFATDWDDEY